VNEEGPVLSIQVTMAAGYTSPGNSLAVQAMRKYVK
jgi:hypothetical protein